MRKVLIACVSVAVLLLLVSCGSKKGAASQENTASESSTVAPIIDTSKAPDIDSQLAKYDEIVTRYISDQNENKTEAVTADEQELATVGEALSQLARDFSSDQLTKYNEITAKLGN